VRDRSGYEPQVLGIEIRNLEIEVWGLIIARNSAAKFERIARRRVGGIVR